MESHERSWQAPKHRERQPLMLKNSLVDRLVEFHTASGGADMSWYACGPTVYDVSHMGHARNYITADVMRRVMEDYFGYRIRYVMNITDVDDKIIVRARRGYLLERYTARTPDTATVKRDVVAALAAGVRKRQAAADATQAAVDEAQAAAAVPGAKARERLRAESAAARQLEGLQDALAAGQHQLAQAAQLQEAVDAIDAGAPGGRERLLAEGSDALAEHLDSTEGAAVDAEELKAAAAVHAQRYEREFLADLDALGVRRPDLMPRVSDYVPQIVEYIAQIQANGLAYENEGSVYFDTTAFEKAGHKYGKLAPWAVGSVLLACESEANFESSAKRNQRDFALWKAAKPGEPFWGSQWGNGRPGWHIECSAMASALIGRRVDVHSGGVDLRFPHHENEVAQAEAFYHTAGCECGTAQWVNYFLHLGHLHIEGLKMSKSLKNFITIRAALEEFSAKQLRLMMCLQPWGGGMTYGGQSRAAMISREKELKEFFLDVDVAQRDIAAAIAAGATVPSDAQEAELAMCAAVEAAEAEVHAALCNNISTKDVLDALSRLISHTQKYKELGFRAPADGGSPRLPQPFLLHKSAAFVTRILSVLGIVEAPVDRPGFGGGGSGGGGEGSSREEAVLNVLLRARDGLRDVAKAHPAAAQDVMALSDRIRDVEMPELGYRLEDRPGAPSAWKPDDPEVLKREAAERQRTKLAAQRKKIEQTLKLKQTELEKLAKLAAKPPLQQELAEKYQASSWDAEGFPTADKDGTPLTEKALKQARKDVEKQRKVRSALDSKPAGYLEGLRSEVSQLAHQLSALELTDQVANGGA